MKHIRNRDDFVREYKDIEIPDDVDPGSTWEGRTTDNSVPIIVLKRYSVFLKKINIGVYIVAAILFLVLLCQIYLFIFETNYAFYIFNDGTDATCILDPKSGVIKQNVK